eukprot:TRINITY_DN15035_c0_g1_i1.p1 TRINITY_DN15035_c0_g1~~TRINITY_DN15035_c0_g1_i1.p1  ORF type:complete len:127 (-),score=27.57 TRINITY_DN15035_c0_g1_i1:97-477(-)
MSWQPFVDVTLVNTGHVRSGAIFGHDGVQWATSPGLDITAAEANALISGFNDATFLRQCGIFLSGDKYLLVRADERSIYGNRGQGGVVAVKTTKAVLIAIYDSKITPGNCAKVVERLADYLIECGF